MRLGRLLPTLAIASAVAVLAPVPADASPPATDPPSTTVDPLDDPLQPTESDDPFGLDDLEPGEIVHSFTLTPSGGPNGDGVGTRSNLGYSGDPGDVVTDAVTMFNLGNEQLTFRIYATDAINGSDGQFDALPGDVEPTDVGTWVDFPQEYITIAPQQQVTVPITITVPDDASAGDHVGAILMSSEALSTGESGEVVTLDRRTGTRLYFRVSGPLRPALELADVGVGYDGSVNPFSGTATVRYRIVNSGNVRLAGAHGFEVAGPFGLGRQSVPVADFPELLPGQSIDVETSVDGVPAFGRVTADVRLEPEQSGDGAVVAVTKRSASAFAPPVTLLLALVGAMFALLGLRAYRRHRDPEIVLLPPDADRERGRDVVGTSS